MNTTSNNSNKDVKDLMKKLKDLEEQLKKKVDNETFNNEVAALREMIGNSEPDDSATKIDVS